MRFCIFYVSQQPIKAPNQFMKEKNSVSLLTAHRVKNGSKIFRSLYLFSVLEAINLARCKNDGNEPSNWALNSLETFITGTMLWYINNRAQVWIGSCLLSYSSFQPTYSISLVSVAPVLETDQKMSIYSLRGLQFHPENGSQNTSDCLIHQIANNENPWHEIVPCGASCWRQKTMKVGETSSFITETIGVTSLKIIYS